MKTTRSINSNVWYARASTRDTGATGSLFARSVSQLSGSTRPWQWWQSVRARRPAAAHTPRHAHVAANSKGSRLTANTLVTYATSIFTNATGCTTAGGATMLLADNAMMKHGLGRLPPSTANSYTHLASFTCVLHIRWKIQMEASLIDAAVFHERRAYTLENTREAHFERNCSPSRATCIYIGRYRPIHHWWMSFRALMSCG